MAGPADASVLHESSNARARSPGGESTVAVGAMQARRMPFPLVNFPIPRADRSPRDVLGSDTGRGPPGGVLSQRDQETEGAGEEGRAATVGAGAPDYRALVEQIPA